MSTNSLSSLSLTAVGSGRVLKLGAPGMCCVLVCFGQETQRDAETVEAAVRGRSADAGEVLMAYVVDLRKVPSMFRRVAEGMLASEYKKALDALEPGQEAWDYIVILPDWKGEVATALGLDEPSKQVGGAVIAADGRLAGVFRGADVEAVVGLVEAAVGG